MFLGDLVLISVSCLMEISSIMKGEKMEPKEFQRRKEAWGNFRLSVVGSLLASPPPKGKLCIELQALSEKSWNHPITGNQVSYSFATIEEWYYQAKGAGHSPVKALEWKLRDDSGIFRAIPDAVKKAINDLHRAHPGWTHKLHYDNLVVIAGQENFGKVPCYSTLRRYRNRNGFIRVRTPRNADRSGVEQALARRETREQRTFESTHVLGLLHSDFHHCSRKILNENGTMDDRSRLICHAQWYWRETAENFIHALCQAFLKRGLPRALMTDNGSPMTATETTQGLNRLSIIHQTTLPYSPNQNGKQECFWGQIEGRLMAMLEGEEKLTLKLLNEATIAWIEMDYHRHIHSETRETPRERFLAGPEVGRRAPSPEELRMAFTVETSRSLRRSDCTISIEGQRYEVPSHFRHLKRIPIRYVEWDLSNVLLINQQSGEVIGRLYPRDLEKNAEGKRRSMEPRDEQWRPPDLSSGIAPLLKDYLSEYAATGLPIGYITKGEK